MRIGREPTLWVAVVSGLLNLVVTFGFDWLTAEQAALWVAAINAVAGVVAALATRPVAPQAFTYLVTTVFAVGAAYGLDVSQEAVGAVNAVVLSVLALLTRVQVTPKATPGNEPG